MVSEKKVRPPIVLRCFGRLLLEVIVDHVLNEVGFDQLFKSLASLYS
jgi:hypothetical protein